MASQEELLKRLEQVTVRLEAICAHKPAIAPKPSNLASAGVASRCSEKSLSPPNMDSIYCSAPRPFNKYPRGYRPMQDDYSNRKLRPSSSWSSFSPATSDQYSSSLQRFPTLDDTRNWQDEPQSRKPFRTESSSTLLDNYSSIYSPRELSPLSVSSEYCNNDSGYIPQSPVVSEMPRIYNTAPITQQNVHCHSTAIVKRENDFLRNLQRQKEEIAKNESRQQTASNFYGRYEPSHEAERHKQIEWSQQEQHQPRRLAKTQSDLSTDNLPPSYYNSQPVTTSSGRLDGFFRNRIIEPNWMNDPPPPKAFRDEHLLRNAPMSSSLSSNFDKFRLENSYQDHSAVSRPLVRSPSMPMPTTENYQYYQAEPPQNYSTHSIDRRFHREPSPQLNSCISQPPSSNFYDRRDHFAFSPARQPSGTYSNTQSSYPKDTKQSGMDVSGYQNVPTNAAVYRDHREQRQTRGSTYESNRNSGSFSNEPIPLSHNRVLHIHPIANHEPYININHQPQPPSNQDIQNYPPPQYQRTRIQSPLRDFARLTSPIRENNIDLQHNEQPQRFNQPPVDERIFSPVESKVFNRTVPTVINGFTSNRHTYNSHTDQYDAQNRRDTSQPPVAIIEPNINVHMPQDPIPYDKPHFGHRHSYTNQRHPHLPRQEYNSLPKRLELSPISTYDNESDLDIEEMARRVLPKYLHDDGRSNGRNGMDGDNLQGILIKNPSLHRTSSKKVVFIDQDRGHQHATEDAPAHVRAYDDAVKGALEKWKQLTDQIGGDIATLKPKVLQVFDNLRKYLWTAAGMQEPSAQESQKMLAPMIELMNDISSFKDSKRNTPQFNHLSTIAEGLPAVGWVVVKKTPGPYIKEYIDASMFFVNRILNEFKETDPRHVEWTKAWREIFDEMQKFVRQVHTTGLVWNSAPGSAPPSGGSAAPAAPAPVKGGPSMPPPPPIPADLFANLPPAPAAVDKDKANRDALFASLNKGEAITSGLRKVTADMQTHKNPNLRGNVAPVPSKSQGAAAPTAKPAQPVRKPSRKELQDGKQWNVEYFVNDPNIVIDVNDKKQTIYVFRCENSVIKVNGKANSITLDGCKKTSIVFDALVAQCETINCQSIQIQTLGELPTLSIQKTDGCQVYLSKVAQGAEIITSKSSEMNILVQTTEDGDYVEFPVPEQFKTTFVNGKLVTTVSDIC
ncbi:unnamed protein product [Caenorhabditis bovis]|uniref:Adenylyl cyclase-associated protein n=1 Tax=Caenorhabditis bovis TaxID=2654633 RepID=A0A8S1EFA1_9PELO|nr:unnamed protein product [Caenorhabditis bovis]